MELTQAIQILNDAKSQRQKEMDILNLAISVLENTFTPELQVLENARAEVIAKDNIINDKQAEIDELKAVPLESVKETPIEEII